MPISNSSLERSRRLNQYYFHNWSATTEQNSVADEIIENPERHLLTQRELIQAEGGTAGITF